MLDADWIAANHDDASTSSTCTSGSTPSRRDELRAIADALRRAGVPLVVTVHDLRNPHHPDAGLHDAQLGVLVEHAAAVITLTPGAAREIAARWGRVAEVLPHPHVVDWDDDGAAAAGARRLRRRAARQEPAGQHGRRRRWPRCSRRRWPGCRARGCRSTSTTRSSSPARTATRRTSATALRALARDARRASSCASTTTSATTSCGTYLNALDVSVLPYRFGTHSGWLEACFDLGTAVVAPSCGFYAEQRPCLTYRHDETRLDAGIAGALRCARPTRSRPAPRATPAARREERRALAAAHQAALRAVLR